MVHSFVVKKNVFKQLSPHFTCKVLGHTKTRTWVSDSTETNSFPRSGIVRHQLVNDEPLGRSVDEAVRMLDALQYFEKNGKAFMQHVHTMG